MMRIDHREEDLENHDRGLDYDLPRLLHRRGMLKLVAGVGFAWACLMTLGACASEGDAAQATQTSDTADGEIPEETSGPYPGDGSNGANVLTQSGIVRSDITSSIGSSTTKAEGVPLSITMTINDFANNKSPLAGGAVYLWHCDREGRYSLYSQGVTNENYLRGVQEADHGGQVRFTTIFPACYSGRWPHIHFEVYPSLAKATNSANKIATSQIALPEATAQGRLRNDWIRAEREQSEPRELGQRQRLQRWIRPADPESKGRPVQRLPTHLQLRRLSRRTACPFEELNAR